MSEPGPAPGELEAFFGELAESGRAPLDARPAGLDLESFGLLRRDSWVVPAAAFDPLRAAALREALSRRAAAWMRELTILPVVGSTNVELMALARDQSVAGRVYAAELQVQGRGRRGRSWSSPFGANLALSIGVAMGLTPAHLGGSSLVVGLAVVDALEQLGVTDLSLKWPNDVLLGGAKLGGILIELSQARATELVIGIGLNVALPPAVRANLPAGVTDLAGTGCAVPRSVLAGRVISGVVEFLEQFERVGFEPFRAPFEARHAYQGCDCQVLLGDARITGTVAGVTSLGELILETLEGRRTFQGGDVSLRRRTTGIGA